MAVGHGAIFKKTQVPNILKKYGEFLGKELRFGHIKFTPSTILGNNGSNITNVHTKHGSFIHEKNFYIGNLVPDYDGIHILETIYEGSNYFTLKYSKTDYFLNEIENHQKDIYYSDYGVYRLGIFHPFYRENNYIYTGISINETGSNWAYEIGRVNILTLDIERLFEIQTSEDTTELSIDFIHKDYDRYFYTASYIGFDRAVIMLYDYNELGSQLNKINVIEEMNKYDLDIKQNMLLDYKATADEKFIYILITYGEPLNYYHSILYYEKTTGKSFVDVQKIKSNIIPFEEPFTSDISYDRFNKRIAYNGFLIENLGAPQNGYKIAHSITSNSIIF